MKLLLVSDVESQYIWDYFDPEPFRGVDLILSCGDLKVEYLHFLVTMIPAPLFYVHGNHDKSFLHAPPEGCECIDGVLRTYKDIRILGLGGCKSEHKVAHEYTERAMRRRVRSATRDIRKSNGFDILITHAPPFGFYKDSDAFHQGFAVFNELNALYRPKLHAFGHEHLSYKNRCRCVTQGDTVFINACGYHIFDFTA